jgi:hypothetical protein
MALQYEMYLWSFNVPPAVFTSHVITVISIDPVIKLELNLNVNA